MKPDKLKTIVKANIRRLRKEQGWTQEELATKLSKRDNKVSKTWISMLESGARTATLETIARLSEAFQVPVEEFTRESKMVA